MRLSEQSHVSFPTEFRFIGWPANSEAGPHISPWDVDGNWWSTQEDLQAAVRSFLPAKSESISRSLTLVKIMDGRIDFVR